MTETKYMTVLSVVAAIMASVIFALLFSGRSLLSTVPYHLLYWGIALYALSFVMSVIHVKRKYFDIDQDEADLHSPQPTGEETQQ